MNPVPKPSRPARMSRPIGKRELRKHLQDELRPRAEAVLTGSRGMGYWFHDTLSDIFAQRLDEDDEEDDPDVV